MIIHGDCIEEMRKLRANSIDAIVTDPPYGLEFMGREWDQLKTRGHWDGKRGHEPHKDGYGRVQRRCPARYTAGAEAEKWHFLWGREALRVLKPGGHLLAFGGTRTVHRLTSNPGCSPSAFP